MSFTDRRGRHALIRAPQVRVYAADFKYEFCSNSSSVKQNLNLFLNSTGVNRFRGIFELVLFI